MRARGRRVGGKRLMLLRRQLNINPITPPPSRKPLPFTLPTHCITFRHWILALAAKPLPINISIIANSFEMQHIFRRSRQISEGSFISLWTIPASASLSWLPHADYNFEFEPTTHLRATCSTSGELMFSDSALHWKTNGCGAPVLRLPFWNVYDLHCQMDHSTWGVESPRLTATAFVENAAIQDGVKWLGDYGEFLLRVCFLSLWKELGASALLQ